MSNDQNQAESIEKSDPLYFLERVMLGSDPRKKSKIFELVEEIQDMTGGEISKSDWEEVVELVVKTYQHEPVSITQSISASKSLAEYKYPKRKALEISNDENQNSHANSPLTKEEVLLFREVFNDEF